MYDAIIIGGGPGGYPCAIRCAQSGMKTALVEASEIGGVCLNKGCIPTKALFAVSGEISASNFKSLEKNVDYRWDKILSEIKTDVVMRLRTGVSFLMKQNGIDVFKGEGKISDGKTVQVGDKTIEGKNIVIATGGTPCTPEICKNDSRTLTSDDLWKMEELPASMAIVGGGVIGCEFASILSRFGVQVSVYEMVENLIPEGDSEITGLLRKSLEKRGVKVFTGKKIESADDLEEEKILVSVGRQPNIPETGGGISIALENGAVRTDSRMKTSVDSIYAVGDVNGKYQFAYTATKEGEIAAKNIMGTEAEMDYSAMPSTVFTDPEISFCGITEKEAEKKGISVKIGRFPYSALGKAYAQKSTEGLVKIIADAQTEEVLGIHIIGKMATELVAFSTLAIKNRMKAEELEKMVYCHPTYAEAIMEAVEDIGKKSIHLPPVRK